MANLGRFKIITNGEYVDLATLTELTFTVDTKYNMQAVNSTAKLTCCIASSAPTDGGFIIKDGEKFSYTPASGENLYVKTEGLGAVYLNIAE